MKKTIYKNSLLFLVIFTVCALVSGCGCGKKKKPDDASTKVMQITITPEATPTPAPEQISSKAVTKNGALTMVNLYLAEGKEAEAAAADTESKTDTDGTEDGSEE